MKAIKFYAEIGFIEIAILIYLSTVFLQLNRKLLTIKYVNIKVNLRNYFNLQFLTILSSKKLLFPFIFDFN